MDKIKNLHLKNMMINKSNYILILLFTFSFSLSGQQKIIQDFNLDNIKDTMYINCNDSGHTDGQPYCEVEIITGKFNKKYNFNIYHVGSPTIGSYGKGNIYLFDWTKDTEYTQEYDYSKKYDDWILTRDEQLLKYENDKEESSLPKGYLLGISGKEYPIKKKQPTKKRIQRK